MSIPDLANLFGPAVSGGHCDKGRVRSRCTLHSLGDCNVCMLWQVMVIEQEHNIGFLPVIGTYAVTAPPSQRQRAILEVPRELTILFCQERLNVGRPAFDFRFCLYDVALADQQRLVPRWN